LSYNMWSHIRVQPFSERLHGRSLLHQDSLITVLGSRSLCCRQFNHECLLDLASRFVLSSYIQKRYYQ